MAERLRIVLAGAAGAMPFAGVAWQVLQYLEGFRRLGHDVFYLEDTERWPYDPVADTVCDNAAPAVAYVAGLMARCGCADAWAYRDVAARGRVHGASERRLGEALASADVLVNLSGATVLRDEHLRVPARVYLETDPVLPQIEVAQGRQFTIDLLDAHTHHFSYGENFGASDCRVPLGRYDYRPTRQPVVLDWWAPRDDGEEPAGGARPFTTVANWRQSTKDVEWGGRLLTWSKHVEFERFLALASLVDVPLELALSLEDEPTLARLRRAGWRVRAAGPLSRDIDAYREYIRCSAGEFSVAKEQNVALRSGWFSDRTASYLASGRPAIVQDTGFGAALPTGIGLLAFSTLEEALGAFDDVLSNYAGHRAAARELAQQYLGAEAVLGRLIEDLASTPAATLAAP